MKQIRPILTMLFLTCVVICSAQTFSEKNLTQVLEKIKDKRIIGLGEAEHFYKGYYSSKFDLIKRLVAEEVINIIALEGSINATSILNDYINGVPISDLPMTLTSLNEPYSLQKAGLFNCLEIAEMINWLKGYNESHEKKIKLIGIDFQNYTIPLNNLKSDASGSQKEKILNTKELLDRSMNAILDSNIMIITSPEWLKRFEEAKENVKSLKSILSNSENKELFLELEQFTNLWDDPTMPRDSFMYENLTKHIDEKSRILLWAHNYHVENDSYFKGPKKLGVFLKERYANEYFIIGVADRTEETKNKIIYPVSDGDLGKYDLLINVSKGNKCDILSTLN